MSQFLILNISNPSDAVPKPVKILLRPDLAPNHVQRIIDLATEGFYDGVIFHRVIPGFIAQGGDSIGTGMHGSTKPDLTQEFNKEPHVRGTCSMARTNNPNSANSQFFICYRDAKFLDGQYTVWGQVVEGMDVIDSLPSGEPPHSPAKIESTQIIDNYGDPVLTHSKWDPDLSPEEKAYADQLRASIRPRSQTQQKIRDHLGLGELTPAELSRKHLGNDSDKRVTDIRSLDDLVQQSGGDLIFMIRNKDGQELDLKSLFLN